MDHVDTEHAGAGAWTAERHVTALYQGHALSLARLALLILGDAGAAEDVVQDAFLGLYRRWGSLSDPSAAPAYLRASVLNGCRTAIRRRSRPEVPSTGGPPNRPRRRFCSASSTARCSPRSGGCRPGSGRRSCSATTST